MGRSTVIIHLSPASLELAVGPGAARIERIDLDPADWGELWARNLRALDAHLSGLLRRAGVRPGARADVIYQSPETRVEVVTVQARRADAPAAARLAIAQGVDEQPGRHTATHVLEAQTNAGTARCHVLCVADADAALTAVVELLSRAGLRPGSLVPSEAVEVLGVAHEIAARKPGEDHSLMLLGEHRTVIAAGDGPSLRCVRTLEFGYSAMIDAVARGARSGSPGAMSPGALREWAREALFRVGVPRRDQAVDEGAGVRAEHVLPLLQPVLQRYGVEVKQTLRFAAGDSGLLRGTLRLIGPGAAIPSLDSVLSTQIDIAVTADTSSDRSTVRVAARVPCRAIALSPDMLRAERDRAAHRRAVLVGAGAAALLIAADATQTLREQYRVQGQVDGQMARLVEVRRDIELRRQAAELEVRVGAHQDAALACLGARPDWAALLDELGTLGGERIRLTDLNAATSGAAQTATISGVARIPDKGSGSPDPLAAYIEQLQRSPLIDGVELGSTRVGEYEGAPVKHFTITARLVPMPPRLADTGDKP